MKTLQTKCKKCGHIGQFKIKKKYDVVDLMFLVLAMFPFWFILLMVIIVLGVGTGICYWEFIPSENCWTWSLRLSIIITLVVFFTIVYIKRKQTIEVCEKCEGMIKNKQT